MSAAPTDSNRILRRLMDGAEPSDEGDAIADARELFADLSLDPASFYGRHGITVRDALVEIQRRMPVADDELGGLRGSALVMAYAVELSARLSSGGEAATAKERADVTGLLRQPDVISTVRALFELDVEPAAGSRAARTLRAVDWSSLEVHRIGTTSIILKAQAHAPSQQQFVLKLVHFLFQGVQPIRDATIGYCAASEQARVGCPHLAEVYASGAGWILQEYVSGPTLGEYVAARQADGTADYLSLLSDLYLPLLRAVASLHGDGDTTHADLNPSNILLQTTGHHPELLAGQPGDHVPTVIRFVDLGRNLLAGDVIGRVRSPDAHFVAPEVATLDPNADVTGRAPDYYSLGLLLPVALGLSSAAELDEGRIPEALFETEPLLARVMADMADPRPHLRLEVLARELPDRPRDLSTMALHLADLGGSLLDAGDLRRPTRIAERLLGESLVLGRHPMQGLRELANALDQRHMPQAPECRHLANWARVAKAAWIAGILAVALSLWLRYGVQADADPFKLASVHVPAALAAIGVSMHRAPNSTYNEACAVGFSFAFAVFQYYMNAFARTDFRACAPSNGRARLAEIVMRMQTVVVLPFVVAGVLFVPAAWPWFSALGMSIVACNNLLVLSRQRDVIGGLPDVGPGSTLRGRAAGYWQGITESATLGDWVPTLFIYSFLVGILAVAIGSGYGHDLPVYAIVMTAVNLVFFGYLEAARKGPTIAPSLARTVVLAERWNTTREATSAWHTEQASHRGDLSWLVIDSDAPLSQPSTG